MKFCIEIHGEADKDGKTPFAMFWARSPRTDRESGMRAQEFRANLAEHSEFLLSQGHSLHRVKDSAEARSILTACEPTEAGIHA